MTKVRNYQSWLRMAIKTYWAIFAILAVVVLAQGLSYHFSATYAYQWQGPTDASHPAPVADRTTGLPFDEYFCAVIKGPAEAVVLALSVMMMIGAGISYMLSAGQSGSKEGVGGVSGAKSMLAAALSGLALFYMSTWLLGDCGFNLGGFIGGFFGH